MTPADNNGASMREKVARAICDVANKSIGMKADEGEWVTYLDMADVVLAALAEPTEAMLAAAIPEPTHLYGEGGRGEDYQRDMRAAVAIERAVLLGKWRDMIGAAK